MKKAFTLIELLMVVAIIGIIATLAVSKMGNVRRDSAMKVSLANQAAIERAVDAYLTVHGGRLNRLDGLMYKNGVRTGSETGFDFDITSVRTDGRLLYQGPSVPVDLTEEQAEKNAGLTPNLRSLLVPYALGKAEADAFVTQLGLLYVMCHLGDASDGIFGNRAPESDDTYVTSDTSVVWSPERSACVTQIMTNGLYVAAVTPITAAGRAVYRDCGIELRDVEQTDDAYRSQRDRYVREAKDKGGILFAFGLGENCTAVGKGSAGLEAAPYADYPLKRFYRHYILLFRYNPDNRNPAVAPEFVGVLDPCGKTIRAAREKMENL